jgi:hypothetical protein
MSRRASAPRWLRPADAIDPVCDRTPGRSAGWAVHQFACQADDMRPATTLAMALLLIALVVATLIQFVVI